MLEFKVRGLAELERALNELPVKLAANVVRGGLRAAAKVVAAEAKTIVPSDTGRLADSIRVSSRLRYGVPEASVKAGGKVKGKRVAFYAHMVEKGTKPHEIRPKGAKSLFIAGVSRTLVNHPGAQAKRFLQRAGDQRRMEAVEAFKAHCSKRLTREGVNVPDPEPETPEGE